MSNESNDSSVKVAVRIKPLSVDEATVDDTLCINVINGENQIVAGSDLFFTFDNVFGVETEQCAIFDDCVKDLVLSFFEGFNATIIAYGQTGSGKTHTMGSASDSRITSESMGIIPRVIQMLFDTIAEKESTDPRNSYKIHIQFLEIYGEDIRDLLDRTKTSKVQIRESVNGETFVSGAREEIVSSTTQMMKTLEEGSKNRTTAATMMNNESSRSHVILEHTIHGAGPVISDDDMQSSIESRMGNERRSSLNIAVNNINITAVEVRRSKFHFVDLAGSERIKRTKAQGTQLKEGIDINKGLLSLGNVISALGDDQKKGKVHVPYRDSKITRILQDSLGGNSKTLFICCVSPASVNFIESVNALKYANRARNIKNKPIVNRDPTLVVIDELKELVQSLATEILSIKSKNEESIQLSERFNQDTLEELASLNFSNSAKQQSTNIKSNNSNRIPSVASNVSSIPSARSQPQSRHHSPLRIVKNNVAETNKLKSQLDEMKTKLIDSDIEIQRLTEQIKLLRSNASDLCDRAIMAESERDYYKIRLENNLTVDDTDTNAITTGDTDTNIGSTDVTSDSITTVLTDSSSTVAVIETTSVSDDIPILVNGKSDFITAIMKFKKENESLRLQLALFNNSKKSTVEEFQEAGESFESDLTSSVARVIAQTKEQLLQEAKRLEKVAVECGLSKSPFKNSSGTSNDGDASYDSCSDDDCDDNENKTRKVNSSVVEEQSFQMRQKALSSQLVELGESILLKENLVQQLKKSQDQYALMKAFYEQKLTMLQKEVDDKEGERELLLSELKDISTLQNQTDVHVDKEKRLKDELKRKEDELKILKKKQDELANLSKVQTRHISQIRKMESDLEAMKKNKVDLTKLLQVEKKNHIKQLHEKVKEVEKLKSELLRKTGEINKLSQEKAKAESRAQDAIREGAALRKRNNNYTNTSKLSNKAIVKHPSLKKGDANAIRYLSQDELKTKRILSTSISKIINRESSIEQLKKQCDQQMALLAQRDELENQKKCLIAENTTPELVGVNTDEILSELDEKINSLNQQLKMRNNNIMKAQSMLDQSEDISDMYDRTIDILKRNLSPSILRMLFEMLVKAEQSTNSYKSIVDKIQQKHDVTVGELTNLKSKVTEMDFKHERELLILSNEYEEKLQGLFENSSVVRGILLESQSYLPSSEAHAHLSDESMERNSLDSYKMVVAILNDKTSYLKNQIEQLTLTNENLKCQLIDMNAINKQSVQKIEESKSLIEFLESEMKNFRDMVNDYKAGILTFGGNSGQSIIKQIQDKANEKEKETAFRNPQGFKRKSFITSPEGVSGDLDNSFDECDDSESVMNEFNDIADEINRTGNVHGGKGISKGVVYDRLTNPVNYTGAMKNIFTNDLLSKKARVQKIKSQANVPNKNISNTHFPSSSLLTSSEYFEERGKENHEPLQTLDTDFMQRIRPESGDSLNQSSHSVHSDSALKDMPSRSTSNASSPAHNVRKSNENIFDKANKSSSNIVSDRLYSIATESTRLKQSKITPPVASSIVGSK